MRKRSSRWAIAGLILWSATSQGFGPLANAALVEAIDLPKVSADAIGEPVSLGSLPAADQTACVIDLFNPDAKTAATATLYDIEKTADGWRILACKRADRTSVGTLRFAETDLRFQWQQEAARAQSAGLRNCLLSVTAGGQTSLISLRTSAVAKGSTVDLRRDINSINIPVDDPPDDENLVLEVTGLSGYDKLAAFDPVDKRVGFKTPLRISLKAADANSPGVQLAVVLMKNGSKLNVNVKPIAVPQNGPALPFTLKSVKEAKNQLSRQLSGAKSALGNNTTQIGQLQTQLARMNGTVVSGRDQIAAAEQRIALLESQITALAEANKQLKTAIPVLQKQLDAMPALQKIADDLHDTAALDFRVLQKVGDKEMELFAARGAKTENSSQRSAGR